MHGEVSLETGCLADKEQGGDDMKIAVASDERTHLTDMVVEELKKRGHAVELFGPLVGEDTPWPLVSQQLAESVVSGAADEGVLFCWTGTGASMAANKVPGIRAALCQDAETAKGARWWNDANVLVMSLRATPEAVAKEILDAWFSEKVLPEEEKFVQQVREIEHKYSKD
jgi:ribose 5-phosphate isomerase B